MPPNASASPDTLIVVKVTYEGALRRFRLKLAECTPQVFSGKIRSFLEIPAEEKVTIERYSDSLGAHTVLDESTPGVYKQLYRAARAKQKLRVKVTKQHDTIAATVTANSSMTEVPATGSPIIIDATPSKTSDVAKDLHEAPLPFTPVAALPVTTPVAAERSSIHKVDFKDMLGKLVADYLEGQEFAEMLDGYVQLSVKKQVKQEVTDEVGKQIKEVARPAATTPQCPALRNASSQSIVPPLFKPMNFVIFCNLCEKNITGTHYHCGSCDNGDYDVCEECKDAGKHCKEPAHWLIKRQLSNGRVISSTTENVTAEKKEPAVEHPKCNICLRDITDNNFATCTLCKGFRICKPCTSTQHGHDPFHQLVPGPSADAKAFDLTKLRPGRNVIHNALCDNCNTDIRGIRHKCVNCPDFDYCDACIGQAPFNHPGHRFVPLAKSIGWSTRNLSRHSMILCDGPLCAGKPGQQSIIGDRYKCSVCPDTDFCGNCEAHPLNEHDLSHPLIKLRTPDKFVSVSTIFSNEEIEDHRFSKNYFESTSSVSVQSNSSTLNNVETAAAPVAVETPAVKEPELKEEERNVEPEAKKSAPVAEEKDETRSVGPAAVFLCDSIADKQSVAPNTIFTQTWTVKVVGERSWPKGTTVTYVGGIAMKPEYGYNASITQEEMEVNDTVDFSVDFMAPAGEVKDAISLTSYWRLTTPDGVKFGPNLWCEIKVVEPKKEEQIVEKAPVVAPVVVEEKEPVAEEKLIDVEEIEVLEEKEEVVENENNTEAEPASSQMIFPMLPKESPASSTHEFQGVSLNGIGSPAPESVMAESVSSGHLVDDDLDSMSDDFENLSEDDFEYVASDGEESLSGHH